MADSPDATPSNSPPHEIRNDESLMRRVLAMKSHFRTQKTPLQEQAFQPRKDESEGISISRLCSLLNPDFLGEWQFKANCTVKDDRLRDTCGVVAVLAQAARELGLKVVPDPMLPEDPGHALFPQINFPDFEGNRRTDESYAQIRIWINGLIELASRRILIAPGTSTSQAPKPL